MRAIATIIVVSALLATIAQAASPRVAPRLYRVDGRPVPVSCLEVLSGQEADSRKALIDLRTCGDPKRKPKAQPDGSVGYDTPDGGYFYYSYIGQSSGIDILLLQSSGGGTGRFTDLVGVKHHGHVVQWAKDYAGGDRCNGGVSNATVSNGRLTFDQEITPYDLIKLGDPATKLEAYKDLDASAASCIGVSHMSDDDKHWTGVTLEAGDGSGQPAGAEGDGYQGCFDRLYRETVAGGHTDLDRRGVTTLAQTFAKRCLRRR